MKERGKVLVFVLLVLFLSFPAIIPFTKPGFFPMHDDTQPARVYEMAKSLSYGQFPVRWVDDLGYGYGYPLFNFYGPLPYYIGGIFHLMGFDLLQATKIMFIIGITLSGITMYLLVRNIVNDMAGLASAVLYMYAPYHAVDIYVRGAVGEFYALGFLPLVMLGIYKIISQRSPGRSPAGHLPGVTKLLPEGVLERRLGVVMGGFGFAGILLSHNILGMITGYFLTVSLLILLIISVIPPPRESSLQDKPFGHPRGVFKALLFTFLLGLGLSAFFILPALVEKNFTRAYELTAGTNNFANHFVYPDQLWDSPWGFAGSAPGRNDGMSFKIGKIHLLLGLLSIPMIIYLHKRRKINIYLSCILCLVSCIFFLSIFLMLKSSELIWEILPGFAYIQYPWRFLSFVILSLSIFPSLILLTIKHRIQIITAIFIIGVTLWINVKYFTPQNYLKVSAEDYISPENLRFKISKISDEYLPPNLVVPKYINEVVLQSVDEKAGVKIISKEETPTRKNYQINTEKSINLLTNMAFFPGWEGLLNDKKVPVENINGRLAVNLDKGTNHLTFTLQDTPIRMLANAISIFSLFLLLYLSLFLNKRLPWLRKIPSK